MAHKDIGKEVALLRIAAMLRQPDAGEKAERIVRRVEKLEREREELLALVKRVWTRWDSEDTKDRPTLALDLALTVGGFRLAANIAHDYGKEIADTTPGYARKVARILKAANKRKTWG